MRSDPIGRTKSEPDNRMSFGKADGTDAMKRALVISLGGAAGAGVGYILGEVFDPALFGDLSLSLTAFILFGIAAGVITASLLLPKR
jgi:hypothetical protein